MAKKERKSVTEIVKTAVGDIKETIKEDFEEIKEELKKPVEEKKKEKQSRAEDPEEPQELTEENTKEKPKKKKKAKRVLLIVMTVMLVLTIAGIIFIYVKLHDRNRTEYQVKGYDTNEIIKKNYIDGFSNISSTGVFNFSLPQDDVNELFSKSIEKLNDRYIDSIYYESGEESHHYFYVDLKIPVIKTRVVIDTVSVEDPTSNSYYFSIQNCTIGKMPAFKFLKEKGYISCEFLGKIAEYSNFPISYVEEYNSIKYEPLKYIDQFPLGDVAGLMFDFAKEDSTAVSLSPKNLGFSIDFKKFRNSDYQEDSGSIEVVDVYQRVKTALDGIDSSTLPVNEPYVVASLSDKELSRIINDSYEVVRDDDVNSLLTNKKAKFSIEGINVKFIDEATMRYVYNVSVNGYICNINQDVEVISQIQDFETIFFSAEEIESGGVKCSGGDNGHVREINGTINDVLTNVEGKQPKAFESSPTNDSFSIYLNGISDELSDIDLKFSLKEIKIDSLENKINFTVTKLF